MSETSIAASIFQPSTSEEKLGFEESDATRTLTPLSDSKSKKWGRDLWRVKPIT